MAERILYSDPATSRDLTALPYEELGAVDNGVWLACPDDTLGSLAERRPPVFLYFHRHEYDVAVSGLSPTRVQEVIRKRRDEWAPQAKGLIQWTLFEGERAALEGALGFQGGRVESAAVERPLTLLQRMAGLERYKSVPAKAMAMTVLQGEAMLLVNVKSALENSVGTPDDRNLLSIHRDRRQAWAGQVARAAVELGAKEFENTLPFADPPRAVFVHPVDGAFEKSLAKGGEPAARWQDGLVFVTPERKFEELRQPKRPVEVLYADSGEFYDSLETLTQAQLHRDFAARSGRTPQAAREDILGHIDKLHLHQILLKRELCARADAARACQFAGFETMVHDDTLLLGYSLARTRTFSRSRGMQELAPAALFQTGWSTVAADISAFGKLAPRYWPAMTPGLQELERVQNGLS